MNLYLQQWADGTVSLVNDFGQVISVFPSIEEATLVCRAWKLETQTRNQSSTNLGSIEDAAGEEARLAPKIYTR